MLLATHIPEDVAVACRQVLVLARGRLLLDGGVDELLEHGRGRVRSRTVDDHELRALAPKLHLVSRVRVLEGLRIRYLTNDPRDPGEVVAPTLEEAYLWLLGEATGWESLRRFRR